MSEIKIVENGTVQDPAPTDAPTTPPTFDANNVISLYSDAYTAATTINNVSWDDSAFEEVSIAGNNVLKISGTNFLGIDLGAYLDATNMTHLHMDYWIATDWSEGQVLNPKLSNHVGEAGETNALDITNIINSQTEVQNWQSKDFVLNGDRESIKQFLITVAGKTGLYYLDNVYLYVDGTAGLEDNNIINVSVYPNPSNTNWNFRTGNTVITSVEVFNLLGKRVVSQNNNSTNVAISTQGLTSGIYIARITTEQGTKSVKLIKE
jgi:endoglucanase